MRLQKEHCEGHSSARLPSEETFILIEFIETGPLLTESESSTTKTISIPERGAAGWATGKCMLAVEAAEAVEVFGAKENCGNATL